MERIKPEASYFTLNQGDRVQYFIFDMTSPANMPYYFEPIFDKLKAKVELCPVMSFEDVQKGFQKVKESRL